MFAKSIEPELALVSTSFDAIYSEIIYPMYEIEIKEIAISDLMKKAPKFLGEYDPFENTAYIDRIINEDSDDPRRAFTLWHEVGGHGILQGDWLRSEVVANFEK